MVPHWEGGDDLRSHSDVPQTPYSTGVWASAVEKKGHNWSFKKNPNQIAVRQSCQQMLFKSTDIRLLSPGASVNL